METSEKQGARKRKPNLPPYLAGDPVEQRIYPVLIPFSFSKGLSNSIPGIMVIDRSGAKFLKLYFL